MRSTDYATIERGVASIAGIEPDNILAHEKTILADYITDATKFCWDYYPWGECTVTEKRYFKDVWSTGNTYNVDDEVYYNSSFYRNHSGANSDPSTLVDWYEIGDNIDELEWQEDGLYSIGARVGYNGKSYACIAVSSLGKTNFLTDGIRVTDTNYFVEIGTFFERFIDYEQTGKNVIENCLGIYTSDPRYTNAKHLNFREGREGIYIEAIDGIINEFWMIYKIAPPIFTSTQTTGDIPRFLTQAIKAHAYQSFLIGEGQHEKAQLQELKILDLLVRETDKIDLQANKNKPYSIEHSSHRIINSRQGQVTASTPHLINKFHQSNSDVKFKITTSVYGRGTYKMSDEISLTFKLSSAVNGRKTLITYRNASISFKLSSSATGTSVTDHSTSLNASFKIQATGVGHRLRVINPNISLAISCNNIAGVREGGTEATGSASITIKTSNIKRGGIGAVVRSVKDSNGTDIFDSSTKFMPSGSTNAILTTVGLHTDSSAQNIFNHRNNNSRYIHPYFGQSFVATAGNSGQVGLGWRVMTTNEFLSTDFGQGKGNSLNNSSYLNILGNSVFVVANRVRMDGNSGVVYGSDGKNVLLAPTQTPLGLLVTTNVCFAYYTSTDSKNLPSSTNAETRLIINTINLNDGSLGGSVTLRNNPQSVFHFENLALQVETGVNGWLMHYIPPTPLDPNNPFTKSSKSGTYASSAGVAPYIIPSAVDQTKFSQQDQTLGIPTEIDGGDKFSHTQLLNRTLSPSDYKV